MATKAHTGLFCWFPRCVRTWVAHGGPFTNGVGLVSRGQHASTNNPRLVGCCWDCRLQSAGKQTYRAGIGSVAGRFQLPTTYQLCGAVAPMTGGHSRQCAGASASRAQSRFLPASNMRFVRLPTLTTNSPDFHLERRDRALIRISQVPPLVPVELRRITS